ncbi:MAG: ABC transporter substrate-binding protein [Thermodesulfobacteriota bacterium]
MKRLSSIMVWALALLFLLHSAWAQSPGVTQDAISVGAIADFSGPVVYILTQELYGELAYVQNPFDDRIYKRKIKIIAEDGGYDPAKHLAAGKLLLDRDNVFCFTPSVGTSPTLALNTLLEEKKVPLVRPAAQSRTLAVPFKKYIFNQMTSYYDQARVCIDYIVNKDPKARIAMMCQDDDMGHEGRDGFLEQCKKHRIDPVGVVTYQRGAKDFSAPMLKLRSLNPDYAINHGIPAYEAAVFKEAQKLGWRPMWMVMASTFKETITLSGESMDFAGDVYAVCCWYPPESDLPGPKEFREIAPKYQPKIVVDYPGLVGYAWGKILVEGLKRAEAANDLTREGLIKALETFKDYETGIFAPLTYTSSSHAGPDSCLVVKRRGDTWVPVSKEWLKAQ